MKEKIEKNEATIDEMNRRNNLLEDNFVKIKQDLQGKENTVIARGWVVEKFHGENLELKNQLNQKDEQILDLKRKLEEKEKAFESFKKQKSDEKNSSESVKFRILNLSDDSMDDAGLKVDNCTQASDKNIWCENVGMTSGSMYFEHCDRFMLKSRVEKKGKKFVYKRDE